MTFGTGTPKVTPTRGKLNDPRPNTSDELVPVRPVAQPAATAVTAPQFVAGLPNVVEVTTKIPHTSTRVTISVQVEPAGSPPKAQGTVVSADRLTFAGGRQQPPHHHATTTPA